MAAIPIAAAVWVLVARHPSRPVDRLHARLPTLDAALAATVVAAVLGSVLNDSGAIVGGVAAMVLTATLVHLLLAEDPTVHEAARAPG